MKCAPQFPWLKYHLPPGPDTIVVPAGTYTLTLTGAEDDDAEVDDLDVTAKIRTPEVSRAMTQKDTVFLMGLVTREEAAAVTEEARNVSGVRRVVKVFEYIER